MVYELGVNKLRREATKYRRICDDSLDEGRDSKLERAQEAYYRACVIAKLLNISDSCSVVRASEDDYFEGVSQCDPERVNRGVVGLLVLIENKAKAISKVLSRGA